MSDENKAAPDSGAAPIPEVSERTPLDPSERTPLEEKIGGGCVGAFALIILIGIVVAVPEFAYFTAGLMTTWLYRKAKRLPFLKGKLRDKDWEEPDVLGTLWELSENGTLNVRLTVLSEALGLPDNKLVREVLDREGVPIRETGVRMGRSTGPGVHRSEVPPPPPEEGPLSNVVTCDNDNDDTDDTGNLRITVERPNDAMTIYRDPAETARRRSRIR